MMNFRKTLFAALTALAVLCPALLPGADSMAVRNDRTGWYTVTTDYYQCTLFPGSMYPVWFNSPDGKAAFPRHAMLDWIKVEAESDLQIYYLRDDCYAELKIVENTPDKLVCECTGRFCMGVKTFKNVTACYRFTMLRNSPELLLEGEYRHDEGTPELQPCLVNCGVLAWERTPFSECQKDGEAVQPLYPENDPKAPDAGFSSDTGMDLVVNGLKIGITGPCVIWNNNRKRYFSYLSAARTLEQRRWDGKAPFRFSVRFRIDGRNAK